jgi:hypothetical protein
VTHDAIIWQILTSVAVILTVVAGHLNARRDRTRKQEVTAAKIDVVQETVNGQTAALTERVDQLGSALTEAGVPVPPKPHDAPAQAGP